MTFGRPARLAAVLLVVAAALAYLRDPPWLLRVESGFRSWETAADGTRYRWTGGHASFFVRADASEIAIPLRTTFASLDDRPARRLLLIDDQWQRVTLALPPRGGRRVRRVDIRVDRTRPGNRGVQAGPTAD
jgi:hypothetical protein